MPRRRQDPDLLARFGARLRGLREAAGLTQQRLADALAVRAATVSAMEAGGLSPTLTTAAAVARTLHVSLAELVDFDAPLTGARPETAAEIELLRDYRALGAERRHLLREVARALRGGVELEPPPPVQNASVDGDDG